MAFNSHKRSDAKPDMIAHGAQATALRAFNKALLFKSAMIHLSAPRTFCLRFPLGVNHLLQARCPIFRRAVRGANTKHFDLTETLEPNNRSVTAAQSGYGDGLQPASVDVHLPVRFQACQKMPAESANQFQIFNRAIPVIAHIPVRD